MIGFFRALSAATKEHLTPAAKLWAMAGAGLFTMFALVGMIKTAKIWSGAAAAALLLAICMYGYRQQQKQISPARKKQVLETVSNGVAFALAREMPYAFDRIPPEEIAHQSRLIRDEGANVATVRLLLLEKNRQEIDLRFLADVFQKRFYLFGKTPGITSLAYNPDFPLLALAGIERQERELLLYIVFADSRHAVAHWGKLQKQLQAAHMPEMPHPVPCADTNAFDDAALL